jgi:hypothetical protein
MRTRPARGPKGIDGAVNASTIGSKPSKRVGLDRARKDLDEPVAREARNDASSASSDNCDHHQERRDAEAIACIGARRRAERLKMAQQSCP